MHAFLCHLYWLLGKTSQFSLTKMRKIPSKLSLWCGQMHQVEMYLGKMFLKVSQIMRTSLCPLSNAHFLYAFVGPFFTVVEYKIADMGHVKYYLAPKIDEEAS